MDITVNVVDAFIDSGQGGNPAGVVLDAGGFSAETKQRIAARVGLSETAFVSPSSVADFKLEFFTPTRQIPHCGHATIATFCYLLQQGKITGPHSSKETIDGVRSIFIKGDMAFMEQTAPTYRTLAETGSGLDAVTILSSIGLASSELMEGQAS